MERELGADITNGTPTLAAALAMASSLSLCNVPCTPMGAMIMGGGSLTPCEEQSVSKRKSTAYVEITMDGVGKHTRNDVPSFQRRGVVVIRAAGCRAHTYTRLAIIFKLILD
jgi:hypothetical protein